MKFTYAGGSRPLEGYTIKRGIGRGGFGEVYYATSDAGKEVALKLVQRNLDVELRGVAHCMNLKNPHLVTIFDVRTSENGDQWVIMEYVAGESLATVLERYPQGLPPEEIRHWLAGIVEGIGYLHERGIVHRDLKPGNIFLEDGSVKIGDYGLSKFISASRRSGQTESVGTVHYMAPELASGKYGKEIDIYAAGVIVYEMLTGKVPFDGESVGEILMKHLTAQADTSKLPPPYDRVAARALAKDPAERYSSMGQLLSVINGSVVEPATAARTAERRQEVGVAPTAGYGGGTTSNGSPEGARAAQAAAGQNFAAGQATAAAPGGGANPLESLWMWCREHPAMLSLMVAFVCLVWMSGVDAWLPLIMTAAVVFAVWSSARSAHRHRQWRRLGVQGRPGEPPAAYWARQAALAARYGGAPPRRYAAQQAAMGAARQMPQGLEQAGIDVHGPGAAGAGVGAAAGPFTARRTSFQEPVVEVVPKTPREKAIELLGSLLMASVLVALFSLGLVAMMEVDERPEHFAFLVGMALAASWGVMVPAKFWEGRVGDAGLRRLAMVLVGVAVGVVGVAMNEGFVLRLPHSWGDIGPAFNPPRWLNLHQNGSPTDVAYLSYFGLVLLVPRWWRLADPLRRRRLSIWAALGVGLWALAVHQFCPFPQPWGAAVPTVAALAVQLASPWDEAVVRARRGRIA